MNKKKIQRLKTFIFEDVWEMDWNALSFLKRLGFGFVRVCFIVVRGFGRDNCPLHASALTYITLMSMVPLIAMMFSVAKGFGAGEMLENLLMEQAAQLPQNITEFVIRMMEYVEKTNFGVLGAVGVLLLFYTVVATMGQIERSFNAIWGVHTDRNFFRKFSDYVSVLLVVPLLILAAISINASLSANAFILFLQQKVPYFAHLYQALASLTGTLFVWVAFTFIFIFMPNTQVRFFPAVMGGVVAGILWQLVQWGYIHLQIAVATYNAIYGTFASIPIFLAWLYLCWLIVLFGCEVAFAVQNFRTYEEESLSLKANQSTREALAIAMLSNLAQHFQKEKGPWSLETFSGQRQIPIRLARDIFHNLIEEKLILETDGKSAHLVPGKPLEKINIDAVLKALRGVPTAKLLKKINLPHYNEKTSLKELSQTKEG